MAKTLFEKEYVIHVTTGVEEVEIVDPTDSMLVVIPAPFLGIETVRYRMTSSGEIHAGYGNFNYIFTKPVVNREDFIEESLLKMTRAFRLEERAVSELEKTLLDFLEYTREQINNG